MNEHFIKNCFTMVSLLREKFDLDNDVNIKDIPASYYAILDIIDHVKSITVTELAEYLNIPQSNCSRSLKKLVAKGWVNKTELIGDRRVQELTLTSEGKEIIEKNINIINRKINAKLSNYDELSIEQIDLDISRLIDKLKEL